MRNPEHLRIHAAVTACRLSGFLRLRTLSGMARYGERQPAAFAPERDDGLIAVPVPQGPSI